jgi:hypothetical protein
MMDHSYSLGLEARDLSARSMRVVKQERNMLDRDEKPRKQRKRALVAVSESDIHSFYCLFLLLFLTSPSAIDAGRERLSAMETSTRV